MSQGSHLLAKSEAYLRAAEMLITRNFYATSIHAAYYGLVQLALYYAYAQYGYTYQKINDERRELKQGTHVWIARFLHSKINSSKKRFIRNNFNKIKQAREEADYQDVPVTIEKSQRIYLRVVKLCSEIKEGMRR